MRIKPDIFQVGVKDPDLRMFDIVIPTEWGTTYNSYLVGQENPVLIDTVKVQFAEEFFANLEARMDISKLQYLIVNHTEPDHAGSIKKLLERAPHVTIYASRAAIQFLQEQLNFAFQHVVVKCQDTLKVGNKTFRFIMAPFLHWPDTMFTYLEEEKVLFTCDGFGCHYCSPTGNMLQSKEPDFTPAIHHYFDFIMGPFKPKVLEAIEKIRALPIELIAPGHGPILDSDPWKVVNLYEKWSKTQVVSSGRKVIIAYVSAYGHTKAMAEHIAEGLQSEGIHPEVIDLALRSEEETKEALRSFDGLIVGSPTLNRDVVEPVWKALELVDLTQAKGKKCAAFGNYGWSGEAVPLLEERLKQMGMASVLPGLKVRFGIGPAEEAACQTFGRDFAQAVILASSKVS